jgi:hypothetical protein
MKKLTNFYISHDKFQYYSDRSIDWFIESWKYKKNSYPWKIARLKMLMYKEESMKWLDEAGKELERCLT